MMKLKALFPLLCASALSFNASAACFADQFSQYTQAYKTWYSGVVELIVKQHPELEAHAKRYLEVQSLTADKNSIALAYVEENHPQHLRKDRAINQWLDLTPELESELKDKSSEYVNILQQLAQLKQAMGGQVDYKLRTEFANLFTKSKDAEKLFSVYLDTVGKLEESSCK